MSGQCFYLIFLYVIGYNNIGAHDPHLNPPGLMPMVAATSVIFKAIFTRTAITVDSIF